MTDATAILAIPLIIISIQLWLLMNSLRVSLEIYFLELLSVKTWDARSRAAQAARKAQELARWKDEHGRLYALDFDTGQVRTFSAERPALSVPSARQWQIALTRACGWGELIGWTERAWRDNAVVYWPETGQHHEQGRRDIMRELDALGITAGGGLGRTWADGMDYRAALAKLDTTPPPQKWHDTPPPTVRLPAN